MNKGFTLFEVVISIGILGMILLVMGLFGVDVYDFGIFLGENLSAQQELQLTLQVMFSELRAMNQSVVGGYALETASGNTISFYSDIDGDGLTDRVRYFLNGNILKKGVIKPSGSPLNYSGTEKITDEIHNIYSAAGNIFSYYDSNYTGSEASLPFPINISAVKLIKASVTVDQSPADAASRIDLSISANMRNL